MRVQSQLAAADLDRRVLETPPATVRASTAARNQGEARLRREADPTCEVAGALCLELEREVAAAARTGPRERALDASGDTAHGKLELDRCDRLAQHARQLARTEREIRAGTEQPALRSAAQRLPARDHHFERVEGEVGRAPPRCGGVT